MKTLISTSSNRDFFRRFSKFLLFAILCSGFLGFAASPARAQVLDISFTSPSDAQKVSGTISAEVAVTNAAIKQVLYKLDGVTVALSSTAPFSAQFDTSLQSNGDHVLGAYGLDENDLEIGSSLVNITIDNLDPVITKKSFPAYSFSPNGDRLQDKTYFAFTLSEQSDVTASIVLGANQIVSWSLKDTSKFSKYWHGKNQSGQLQGNGKYELQLSAIDEAGNTSSYSAPIYINNSVSKAKITNPIFSPNGDKIADNQFFSVTLKNPATLRIEISRKGTKLASVNYGSKSAGRKTLVFRGKTSKGTWLPHGTYTLTLYASNAYGTVRLPYKSAVDRKSPVPQLEKTGIIFPFKNNFENTPNIKLKTNEKATTILRITRGNLIQEAAFNPAFSVRWRWDGKDKNGITVPSGTYRLQIISRDLYGNARTSNTSFLVYNDIRGVPRGFYIANIEIDLSSQVLNAYSANGRSLLTIYVSSGRPGTPTPKGYYRAAYKKNRLVTGSGVYAEYPVYFRKRYAIHGWPRTPSGRPLRGQPGTPLSHGCVRTDDVYARVIWSSTSVGGTRISIQQ